jgi:hypothetical protein
MGSPHVHGPTVPPRYFICREKLIYKTNLTSF